MDPANVLGKYKMAKPRDTLQTQISKSAEKAKQQTGSAYIKNKVPEKYPLGGRDPVSGRSYSD